MSVALGIFALEKMRIAIGIIRANVLSNKLFDSIQSLAYTMHGKIRI
jgi:hypothetical protein